MRIFVCVFVCAHDCARVCVCLSMCPCVIPVVSPTPRDVEHSNDLHTLLKGCGGVNVCVLFLNYVRLRLIPDVINNVIHNYENVFGSDTSTSVCHHLIILVTHVDDDEELYYFKDDMISDDIHKNMINKL